MQNIIVFGIHEKKIIKKRKLISGYHFHFEMNVDCKNYATMSCEKEI